MRKLIRRWWVRPVWQRRRKESEFFTAMPSMEGCNDEYYRKYYRMMPNTFKNLQQLLQTRLRKLQRSRTPISVGEQLALTLRYLSSGSPIQDIALAFRVGISTASTIIHKTCRALWDILSPSYMKVPSKHEWAAIADQFEQTWQFPMCMGAVDGKHIAIQAPGNSGSMYFNYKGTFSIVLMAVADSQHRFVMIDVGGYGRQSDGGTFKSSPLGAALENGTLPLPPCKRLKNTNIVVPPVFIGDEAFQLQKHFMRPFSCQSLDDRRRILNYRLSRARLCIENTFGIISSRWRLLRRPINLKVENVDAVVKAICVLHNYLMAAERTVADPPYCTRGFVDYEDNLGNILPGEWRSEGACPSFYSITATHSRRSSQTATDVRDAFCDYFFSKEGEVEWQWDRANVKRPHM